MCSDKKNIANYRLEISDSTHGGLARVYCRTVLVRGLREMTPLLNWHIFIGPTVFTSIDFATASIAVCCQKHAASALQQNSAQEEMTLTEQQ